MKKVLVFLYGGVLDIGLGIMMIGWFIASVPLAIRDRHYLKKEEQDLLRSNNADSK